MAKSKKERRSSIRHMEADDAYSVLEALEKAEQQAQQSRGDDPEPPDGAEDRPGQNGG